MSKEKETSPPELIKEVNETEIEEDSDYRENEEYTRAIYNKLSTYQLELVNKLLNFVKTNKQANYFFVGLYPSGKYLKEREKTHIKERFLKELEESKHLDNLYSRIVDVPDRECPFTSEVIVADFQYHRQSLVKALETAKIDLEHKIHVRTSDRLKFENEKLTLGGKNKDFKGGQGKMMELLFHSRREIVGTEMVNKGKSISITKLKDIGGYTKSSFRDALKPIRAKLKKFNSSNFKIEIRNTSVSNGLYQLIIHHKE